MPEPSSGLMASLRGAQLPTVSSVPIAQIGTEIGIATLDGLKVFSNHSMRHAAPGPDTPEDTDSDSGHSCDSDVPLVADGTYLTFSKDYKMLTRFLDESGFSEDLSATPGQNLEEQVEYFLTTAAPVVLSGAPYSNLTRIIIYTGHNSRDHGRFSLKAGNCAYCTYYWAQLSKAMKRAPPHVLVVTILACCFAGDAVDIIKDKLVTETLPKLVMIASSSRVERSFASSVNGDHVLGALIETLQAETLYRSYHNWDAFRDLLIKKMKTNRQVHGLKWEQENPQTPFICMFNVNEFVSQTFYQSNKVTYLFLDTI